MKRAPFSHDDVLANHDAKQAAIASGKLKEAMQRAEVSSGYALWYDLGMCRITKAEFIQRRNDRLRDQAERLRRAGCEPHHVASELAKESIFKLSAHQIRIILHLKPT